jgi:hypothetical protein
VRASWRTDANGSLEFNACRSLDRASVINFSLAAQQYWHSAAGGRGSAATDQPVSFNAALGGTRDDESGAEEFLGHPNKLVGARPDECVVSAVNHDQSRTSDTLM